MIFGLFASASLTVSPLASSLPSSIEPVMVALLVLLGIATVTDVRSHRIPNWLTYPGMLSGLLVNSTLGGVEGFWLGIGGLFCCGFLMLVCFLLFDVGGGDVKLMAMIGSFLGTNGGIELLLWTCVLGAAMGIVVIVWREGAWNLFTRAKTHLALVVKTGGWVPLNEEDHAPLRRWLFLAPASLTGAVVMVLFR